MPQTILAVEDEAAIRDMVRFALERHGYTVHAVAGVVEARELLKHQSIDLAIVDWMLAGASGLNFVRSLRSDALQSQLPIIMLTARTDENDITAGLDAGADDYMTKPFSPKEMHSRIKALLRRRADYQADAPLVRGPFELDTGAHRFSVNGTEVPMGHTEYKLMTFLMQHPDRVYSRAQLLDHVWGPGTFIEERTVDVHILRLRKCLKPFDADRLIDTVRGAGYRLTLRSEPR